MGMICPVPLKSPSRFQLDTSGQPTPVFPSGWMLKIPFPKLGFLWPAGVIRHHKSGLRFSTEVRQNHSQKKLERVYLFIFFISVTGTSLNIYTHIYIYSLKLNLLCNWD